MVLRHHISEICRLTDDERRTVPLVIPPDGGGIGPAPIHGDHLGHAVPADGFAEGT
jgi:hypothetical protein